MLGETWCKWCGSQIKSTGGMCPCTEGQFIYIPTWYTVDESGKMVVCDPGWEGPTKYLPERYKRNAGSGI